MNYSRNIKKTSIGRRVLTSWVIIAVLFSLIGGFIGAAIATPRKEEIAAPEQESKPGSTTEIRIYGKPDGIIQGEIPGEWKQTNLNFVPLDVPMERDLQEFIFYLSAGYDIDFTFVMALIQQESSFRVDVVSVSDDYGLMQINQQNHEYLSEQLGITDFLEPYSNIKAGMFILRKLFDKYENPGKVLMAYNMGETGASRLWEQGIFESNYSRAVLRIQAELTAGIERSSNDD